MYLSRFVAVSSGAGHVAFATFSRDRSRRLRLHEWSAAPLAVGPVGLPEWSAALAEAWVRMTREHALAGVAPVALPAFLSLIKTVRVPAVSLASRKKILQFEIAQHVPYTSAEMLWDYQEEGARERRGETLVAAARRAEIERFCEALSGRSFWPEALVPAAVALHRCFLYNYPDQRGPVLLVQVGARATQLLFVGPGGLHVRILPWGGHLLTQALRGYAGGDFAAAEALKLKVLGAGLGTPEERAWVEREADVWEQRLTTEVIRAIGHQQRHGGGAPLQALYFTGGALLPASGARLAQALSLPGHRLDVWRRVDRGAADSSESAPPPALADLVGLAALWSERRPLRPNLLPMAAHRRAREHRSRARRLVASVALALGLGSLAGHYLWSAARLEADAAGRVQQLPRWQTEFQRNEAQRASTEAIRRETQTLQRIEWERALWIRFLADLQERLTAVEDVWLRRLHLRPPEGGPAGARRLELAGSVLDIDPAIATLPRVKRLVANLRDSPFVQRVEDERFEPQPAGGLHFEVTLVMAPPPASGAEG